MPAMMRARIESSLRPVATGGELAAAVAPAGVVALGADALAKLFVTVVDGAQTGDQIVTVGENGTLLYFAYVKNQGWSGLPDIGPGIGFWIKTQADTTIAWPKE